MSIDIFDSAKNGSYSDFHDLVKNELNDRYDDNSRIKSFTDSISRLKNLQSALDSIMNSRASEPTPEPEPDSSVETEVGETGVSSETEETE